METLLAELKEAKETYAYGQNHLLDTIIQRCKEIMEGYIDTDTTIGY